MALFIEKLRKEDIHANSYRDQTFLSDINLLIFPLFYELSLFCFVFYFLFLFKLCIHPPITFHSSHSKSTWFTCQNNNIIRIIFFNLWELWWNHQIIKSRNKLYVRSLMSRVTLQLDKCLEKVESANCSRHPRNWFKKRFVIRGFTYLGICASRLFLRS